MVEIARSQLGQFRSEGNRRDVGRLEEGVVIGQLAHLAGGNIGHLRAAIADIHAPKAGHAVEDAMTFAIGQIDALCPCNNPRPLLGQLGIGGERMHMVSCVKRLKLLGGQVIGNHRHDALLKCRIAPAQF